jgi:hypothetical protein
LTTNLRQNKTVRGPSSSNKPKAKRLKNEILDNSKYTELSTAFNKNYQSNISCKDIAFMDITLQNHRSVNSIFKKNNTGKHLQFADYATAVFTGLSGSSFSGQHGLTTDTPILCQMEMAAPDRAIHKKSYQWILFYPRMNLVSTCHNYSNKHAWTLGKETIAALAEKNTSFINTRLGKLAFPHKQDNVRSLNFVSAVFVAPKNSSFYL